MKKLLLFLFAGALISAQSCAQNTQKEDNKDNKAPKEEVRESPLQKISQKLNSGATISIQYGQPSIKGREVGKSVEPMDGQVWRTGANEASVFQTDKDVKINGQPLAAGKYGFFTLFNGDKVTLIFNNVWEQWGAFSYDASKDALRVDTKAEAASPAAEKLVFTISPDGNVSFVWGPKKVDFSVQ